MSWRGDVSALPQSQALSQSCSSLRPALVGDDINAGASIHCADFALCKHSWGLITKCCMHVDEYGRMAQILQQWKLPGEPPKLAHRCFVRIGISQLCHNWHATALSGLVHQSFVRIGRPQLCQDWHTNALTGVVHQCFVRIGRLQLCQDWHTTALSGLAYHSFVRVEDYDGLGLAR